MTGTKIPGAMTREMIMVHTAFRREFGLMPELIRDVAEGDRERAGIVADHVGMIGGILHHHHSGEDRVLWPHLLQRCPEELAPLVHSMEEHHDRIGNLGSQLAKTVDAWRADADTVSRDAAADLLDQLLPVLHEHLGTEEQRVLPLVEKHITGDEWDGMVAESAASTPPEMLPLALGMMMYEGDPSAVQDALDNIPAEVRAVVAEQAPAAYAAYAQRVYGTSTPRLS
ncbi:hemerythrin domain-containing protein [Actinoplanes sp. NPDC051411]|uniref:hemerythrin domain-containing protein n=1 Tax=Actinoplanes sp. NPDC051411 TaxID=3155522 RepID=UPI003444D8F9